MIAKDFRRLAWNALGGKWLPAILTGLIASLLGGNVANFSSGVHFKFNTNSLQSMRYSFGFGDFDFAGMMTAILPMMLGAFAIAGIWMLVALIVGGTVSLGYAQFNLDIVDGGEARIETLFSRFSKQMGAGVAMRLLVGLFTFLWSLLFITPGIIASYRYAMTPYILAENPELGVMDAINASKEMMKGNKFRLFCLHFSFIGWDLLSLLTFGILSLFLHPYKEAANAAFYRELTGTPAQSEGAYDSDDGWSYGSSWNV